MIPAPTTPISPEIRPKSLQLCGLSPAQKNRRGGHFRCREKFPRFLSVELYSPAWAAIADNSLSDLSPVDALLVCVPEPQQGRIVEMTPNQH